MAENRKPEEWLATFLGLAVPLLVGGHSPSRKLAIDIEYFDYIGIDPNDPASDAKMQRALEVAHRLRSFEIEMYWKRATYAWAFQVIAFGGMALAFKGEKVAPSMVGAFSAIGTVAALAAYLTALGSKFWQENWEGHVQRLGAGLEGHLTDVILCRGGKKFSVSRINEMFLLSLFVSWFVVFLFSGIYFSIPGLSWVGWLGRPVVQFGIIFLFMIITITSMVVGGGSRLTDKVKLDLDPKQRPGAKGR